MLYATLFAVLAGMSNAASLAVSSPICTDTLTKTSIDGTKTVLETTLTTKYSPVTTLIATEAPLYRTFTYTKTSDTIPLSIPAGFSSGIPIASAAPDATINAEQCTYACVNLHKMIVVSGKREGNVVTCVCA